MERGSSSVQEGVEGLREAGDGGEEEVGDEWREGGGSGRGEGGRGSELKRCFIRQREGLASGR